ncbi:hypothetical protein AgCh_024241 [Apium graveolens]
MRNYEECWWAHGEKRNVGFTSNNSGSSSTYYMDEMVHDIAGQNFGWKQAREQPMNSDAKAFSKLLEEGREPLWHGCTKNTKLSAVATLLNIKADHNISHECFESLLKAIKRWSTDGKLACPYCMEHTKSFTLQKGRKPCWFDYHHRFLPENHPFRRNRENFRKGKVENDSPVPQLSGTEMRARVMRLSIIPFGKKKDNDKARLDLKDICKCPALELQKSSNGKTVKPHARWMYPFERLMGMLKWAVKNRACVEGSICEAYSFNEISMFVSDYFLNEVLTKANRVPRNDDGGNIELNGKLSVFGLSGRAYGKGSEKDFQNIIFISKFRDLLWRPPNPGQKFGVHTNTLIITCL